MSEPKIHFDCSSCGHEVWAPPRGAGRNAPCPKCGTSCEIPFPGKNQLRLRCGADGTEYGLDHAGPCEVCDEADNFQRFCLRHQTTIGAGPCLECVRAAEQDFQKAKHLEKRKARKKTTRRNKEVPPPYLVPNDPRLHITANRLHLRCLRNMHPNPSSMWNLTQQPKRVPRKTVLFVPNQSLPLQSSASTAERCFLQAKKSRHPKGPRLALLPLAEHLRNW